MRLLFSGLLLTAVLLAAAACSSNGSGSGGNSPTATPTDIVVVVETETPVPTANSAVEPYPTNSPTPTPVVFPPMEVVFLDASDFGDPVSGTVYEELLARLPDNEVTRSYAKLADYAGFLEFLDIERPEPGASGAEFEAFLSDVSAAWAEGLVPEVPAWPLDERDYFSVTNWFPNVGFDLWSVNQSIFASERFNSNSFGSPPRTYEIAFGRFGPQQTADALADCQCDQPVINVHDGVEYYSWSEEGEEFIGDLQRRNTPPLYDHIGRGPQLLVRDGEAYYSITHAIMQNMIDVLEDNEPSLADDSEYMAAARRLASLGLMRDKTFFSSGFSIDEILSGHGSQANNPVLFEEVVRKTDLFEPFDMVATGIGFDGERAFTGFVVSNPDEATAQRNAEVFAERLRDIPKFTRSDDTHAEDIKLVEIAVDDNLLVARIYFHRVELHQFGFPIPLNNTWLVYE